MRVNISYAIILIIILLRLFIDQRFIECNESVKFVFNLIGLGLISLFFIKFNIYFNSSFINRFYVYVLLLNILITLINHGVINHFGLVFQSVFKQFFLIALGFFAYQSIDMSSLRKIMLFSWWLVVFIELMQMIGVLPVLHLFEGLRMESLTGHPNALANFLTIQIGYWIFEYFQQKKIIDLIYGISSLVLIMPTQSRTALIMGMFISVILFLNWAKDVEISKFRKRIIWSVVFVVLIGISFALQERLFSEFFDSSGISFEDIKGGVLKGSFTWRLYNWYWLVNYMVQNSLVWGFGINTVPFYNEIVTGAHLEAHNEYVRVIFEIGLVGFLIYLFLLGKMILHAKKLAKYNSEYYLVFVLISALSLFKVMDGIESSTLFMIFFMLISNVYLKAANERSSIKR